MWCMPCSIDWMIITFSFNKILKKRLVFVSYVVLNRLLADFYRLISRDQITTRLRQKLYKHSQCSLLEPIAAWQRYHANNYSIILLNSCELYVTLWSLYLAVKISQCLEIRLLHDRDISYTNEWPMPNIRTHLWPRND